MTALCAVAAQDNLRLFRRPEFWALVITLLAFFLRVWQLESVPPGWRDDELIETLVISQNILDGELSFYYPDASGHEALYHVLNALFLGWFGPGGLGIRLLSAFAGTLAVPATYALGRRLFGAPVGLTAAALLAVSFWGLMYSRVGIRHVLTPVLATLAFLAFWRAIQSRAGRSGQRIYLDFALAGLFLGLGIHSYFASRGTPLVLAAFAVFLLLFAPSIFRRNWRGMLLTLAVTVLVALPLVLALAGQPEAEGRVGELAQPLNEALDGDFALMGEHIIAALTMTHATGDPEWLYNIPERPLFGVIGAIFFWLGVALALWWALRPLPATVRHWLRREQPWDEAAQTSLSAAFLLIWWVVGISPAFLSVPTASLGHVIMAQPAFCMLAALPIGALLAGERLPLSPRLRSWLAGGLVALLLLATAARDLTDYFSVWPERGMVRFLYRADIADVARFINESDAPPQDFGITGLLAGPWDREALAIALDSDTNARPRWYNPERALLLEPAISFAGYPDVAAAYPEGAPLPEGANLTGGYRLVRVEGRTLPGAGEAICFNNGLCATGADYNPGSGTLELGWTVGNELALPPLPLISNPPPPGVYSGPRLYVFAQLVDAAGNFLTGDDGLWVDPATLRPGDDFVQQHRLGTPGGATAVLYGLYDPMTGERILTGDGRDHIRLELE